jgi:hypothetical protein
MMAIDQLKSAETPLTQAILAQAASLPAVLDKLATVTEPNSMKRAVLVARLEQLWEQFAPGEEEG